MPQFPCSFMPFCPVPFDNIIHKGDKKGRETPPYIKPIDLPGLSRKKKIAIIIEVHS